MAAALLSTLGGCIPERDTTPALYMQYSIADPASLDSAHCFNECLRWPVGAERETCLSNCDGVATNVTAEPCTPPAPNLCTYVPAVVTPDAAADDDSNAAAAIIGGIFKLALAAVTEPGDHDDQRSHAHTRRALEPATHHEPSPHHEPATARAAQDKRHYVVERPRPEPRRPPRAPST